jgi:S1-C subfamily serine protease
MKRTHLPLLMLLLLAAVAFQGQPSAQSAPAQPVTSLEDFAALESRIQQVVELVRPAVVCLRMQGSSGSGTFISEDGWIATAGHVSGVRPGTNCRVILHGGETLEAVVYGWHERMDYGLVKADTQGRKVPYVEIGNSGELRPGQWLIAMGHPLGHEPGRDAVVRAGRCLTPENARSRVVVDAPVISGDSGGPVFDLGGRMVAINQSIQTNNVHINNVAPVDLFKELLPRLREGEGIGNAQGPQWGRGMREPEEGALNRQEMQTYMRALRALQERELRNATRLFDRIVDTDKRPGAVFYNAACAYSLYSAELSGDEKTEMQQKALTALGRAFENGFDDFEHAANDGDLDPIRELSAYQELIQKYRRFTQTPVIGMTVRSARGIRVVSVAPGSPAEAAGLEEGDIIERIGSRRLQSASDWISAVIEDGIDPNEDIRVRKRGRLTIIHLNLPSFGARVFGQAGARLVEVFEDSLAFNSGLRPDDIIEEVNGERVDGGFDFANMMLMSDANEESELTVRRGFSRELIKFSYSMGDLSDESPSGVLPGSDWKQGENLLTIWRDLTTERTGGAVFPIRQLGRQAAFATVVSADGYLITKASQIQDGHDFELLEGTNAFKAEIVARNDRYDIALLKVDRKFDRVVEFKKAENGSEFPPIGGMVASVDARGSAFAHGFIALPSYDSDRQIGPPDPNAPFMGINARDASGGGAEVTAVTDGAPAGRAGIRVGDVILRMNGQLVPDWTSLIAMIRGQQPDATVTLSVRRGEDTSDVQVTLMPRAQAMGQQPRARGTGRPELGIRQVRAQETGVEITVINAGSPAELAGINTGETLLRIDDREITNQRDVNEAVSAKRIGDYVTVVLLRDDAEVLIEVQLAEEDAPPAPPAQGRPNVAGPVNARLSHFGAVIQHDGVVLPAQQGGPVIDLRGNVIGLNIARADRTHTFALLAHRVALVLEQLMEDAD